MPKGDAASKDFVRREIAAMRKRIQRAESRATELRNLVRDMESRIVADEGEEDE